MKKRMFYKENRYVLRAPNHQKCRLVAESVNPKKLLPFPRNLKPTVLPDLKQEIEKIPVLPYALSIFVLVLSQVIDDNLHFVHFSSKNMPFSFFLLKIISYQYYL